MLSSMTGFGRAVLESPLGRLCVEISSVNRKYLEISVSSPKELSSFEHEVRKWVTERLSRGQIFVRIYLELSFDSLKGLLPDGKLLKAFKKNWDKVAKEAGVEVKDVDLQFLLQYLPPKAKEVSSRDVAVLRSCVEEALKALTKMKQAEGKAMAADLSNRLTELKKMIAEVEKRSSDATERMRNKLFEKIQDVMQMGPEVEERLLREVALFAERVDISEEITRFQSHMDQFKKLLKEEIVGRKMEFLLQEIGREVNTIGSKSMDINISHAVVSMKSELEKMREQVQNIE